MLEEVNGKDLHKFIIFMTPEWCAMWSYQTVPRSTAHPTLAGGSQDLDKGSANSDVSGAVIPMMRLLRSECKEGKAMNGTVRHSVSWSWSKAGQGSARSEQSD